MCVYVCVCISLFKYRRIEKVIQGQTLHILSDIYTIGPIKRNIFIGWNSKKGGLYDEELTYWISNNWTKNKKADLINKMALCIKKNKVRFL